MQRNLCSVSRTDGVDSFVLYDLLRRRMHFVAKFCLSCGLRYKIYTIARDQADARTAFGRLHIPSVIACARFLRGRFPFVHANCFLQTTERIAITTEQRQRNLLPSFSLFVLFSCSRFKTTKRSRRENLRDLNFTETRSALGFATKKKEELRRGGFTSRFVFVAPLPQTQRPERRQNNPRPASTVLSRRKKKRGGTPRLPQRTGSEPLPTPH